jgi:hypothetical protein
MPPTFPVPAVPIIWNTTREGGYSRNFQGNCRGLSALPLTSGECGGSSPRLRSNEQGAPPFSRLSEANPGHPIENRANTPNQLNDTPRPFYHKRGGAHILLVFFVFCVIGSLGWICGPVLSRMVVSRVAASPIASNSTSYLPWIRWEHLPPQNNNGGGQNEVHLMVLASDGLIWIARGSGACCWHKAEVVTLDPSTGVFTVDFEVPNDMTYLQPGQQPYIYWIARFQGTWYAAQGTLGQDASFTDTADIYRRHGPNNWTRVLHTPDRDCYALQAFQHQLYAGCGQLGTDGAGKLWVTSDGVNWDLAKQFDDSGKTADTVRVLKVYHRKLYIGVKNSGRLWSYDGTTFTDLGVPGKLSIQVKTLLAANDKLYVGGNPAYIYSTFGDGNYTLEASPADDGMTEVYHGFLSAEGRIFFPTNGGTNPANIYEMQGGVWAYTTPDPSIHKLHTVVEDPAGNLYTGGVTAQNGYLYLWRSQRGQ